jgi:hypothetical protein
MLLIGDSKRFQDDILGSNWHFTVIVFTLRNYEMKDEKYSRNLLGCRVLRSFPKRFGW